MSHATRPHWPMVRGFDAIDPLHNSSRSMISLARAACCVVFLVNLGNLGNSQLLTAKRHLASHADPLGKLSPNLCRGLPG